MVSVSGSELSVPLREPFIIASGRIDVTRAVLVRVTLELESGGGVTTTTGLGEAAALPPVTREDQPELLRVIAEATSSLRGIRLDDLPGLEATLAQAVPSSVVARAAIEAAALDAWARAEGVSLARMLSSAENGGAPPAGASLERLTTDITLPISAPGAMALTAERHHRAGFSCFKVKVGLDWRADREALLAVAHAVPSARFRLDANGGFRARDALALLDAIQADGLAVECYEQPCARDDWAGMAEVTARSSVPIVADESFRDEGDLAMLLDAGAAHAVNLKLVKMGGPLRALALGRRARAAGLRLMAGAMVETRVGLLAMAHVVAALGGVDWVDLDTAFLLADDPFVGGWTVDGPHLDLIDAPGLGGVTRTG
jgi:L-alanine-DL-glutamate epimerase-like enolase superfamily enzyme